MEIKLGTKVKDAITGFEGVAVCRAEWLGGNIRIGVASTKLGGSKEEGEWIRKQEWLDEVQLASDGVVVIEAIEPVKHDFKHGQRVRDKYTGYEGIIVAIDVWLNGCVRMEIQGVLDKDGKVPDAVSLELTRAEIIEETKEKKTKKKCYGPAAELKLPDVS